MASVGRKFGRSSKVSRTLPCSPQPAVGVAVADEGGNGFEKLVVVDTFVEIGLEPEETELTMTEVEDRGVTVIETGVGGVTVILTEETELAVVEIEAAEIPELLDDWFALEGRTEVVIPDCGEALGDDPVRGLPFACVVLEVFVPDNGDPFARVVLRVAFADVNPEELPATGVPFARVVFDVKVFTIERDGKLLEADEDEA